MWGLLIKDLLSDSSKFKVASIKTGKEIRHVINVRIAYKEVLDDLLCTGKISQQTFWKLDPIGCKPGVLYGLSKVMACGVVVSMFDFHRSDRGSNHGRGGEFS